MTSIKNFMKKVKNNKIIIVLIKFFNNFFKHDIFGMAAKSTYYLLLSFFPLTLLIVTLASKGNYDIFQYLLPLSVMNIIKEITPRNDMTVVSAVLLMWSASTSIWALMSGIHTIHTGEGHIKLRRRRLRALLFIVLLTIAVSICVSLTFLSNAAINWLADNFFGRDVPFLDFIRFAFIFCFIFLFALFLYLSTPNLKIRIRNFSAGAIFSACGWFLATKGFEIYMEMFNNYSVLYGGIGTFLGLALWLYVISIILFCGAEINALIYGRNRKQYTGIKGKDN